MNWRPFVRVVMAEAYKQYKVYWTRPLNVLTEAVYPALHFAAAYYMFRPFTGASSDVPWAPADEGQSLALFLLTGFLGFTIFQRLLWSAFDLTNLERFAGTLEIQYLTPANRFALLLGAATGGFVRTLYLYGAFLAGALVWIGDWRIAHPAMLLVVLLAVAVPALAWGTLFNARLLFARDFSAYVSILQPPLNFFGGVRFPVSLLPGWMQVVSAVLPLTWSLNVMRKALLEAATLADIGRDLGLAMFVAVVCFVLAYFQVRRSERLARERGTLILY